MIIAGQATPHFVHEWSRNGRLCGPSHINQLGGPAVGQTTVSPRTKTGQFTHAVWLTACVGLMRAVCDICVVPWLPPRCDFPCRLSWRVEAQSTKGFIFHMTVISILQPTPDGQT